MPIIVLAGHDESDPGSLLRYGKTLSNIREFAERGIPILAVITEGDDVIVKETPYFVTIPPVPALLQPMLEVVPLQPLAYHAGVLGGYNVDQPRNLSKSVLVE